MNTVQRIAWLNSQPGLSGITFKRRTKMFHARVQVPVLGMAIQSAGCKTLAHALEVRDTLRTLIGDES